MLTVSGLLIEGADVRGEQRGSIPADEASRYEQVALGTVRFSFQNEGHFLKAIGVLQEGTSAIHAVFQDNDGNDPYDTEIRYRSIMGADVVLGEFTRRIDPPEDYTDLGSDIGRTAFVDTGSPETSFTESFTDRTYSRTLHKPSGDHVLVLRGFKFQYWAVGGDEADHKTRRMTVMPGSRDDLIEISFGDVNFDDPFEVTIQYAFLPPTLVREVIDVSLPPETDEYIVRFSRSGGTAVISGFSFEFSDENDKHIENFCVDALRNLLQFNSGDTRNRIDAELRLVTLRTGCRP